MDADDSDACGAGGSDRPLAPHTIVVEDVHRDFKGHPALQGVSLAIPAGTIHALLGPNGAGKTTLLRILCGLAEPSRGSVWIDTRSGARPAGWASRDMTGIVASGGRSFYLRLSGLENLTFFARLHGLTRKDALARGRALLIDVGLEHAGTRPVGEYSQGMRRRLAVARALIAGPRIVLMDEATHDLDPEGAHTVRDLARRSAQAGAAVVWATQRLEEIRGFADTVTLLDHGRVRFAGTVDELLDHTPARRYVVRIRDGLRPPDILERELRAALPHLSVALQAPGATDLLLLELTDDTTLGAALTRLSQHVDVLACREERSEIESAFLDLTRSAS